MASVIRFGTDGWRGVIAEDYTFDNVRRAAQGVATWLLKSGKGARGMVVGYDHRFDSEHFADASAEVLAANGIPMKLVNRGTPTPVISYAILANKTDGAINITASHNPSTDNGFKVRTEYGGAADPDALKIIEASIPPTIDGVKRMAKKDALAQGLIEIFDPAPAYLAHLQEMIDVEPIKRAGLTIVHDAMWGVGAGWLAEILAGGKTRVVEIHNIRNPLFPEMARPEPIPPNVNKLLQAVVAQKASAGVATDGDSDRVGFVSERGEFVNQLQVYALLALYLLEVRGWRGPIVKTLSTTSMLEKLGQRFDVPVYETGVGFKYVAPKMLETNAMIGGEESGGFAFRGHMPERDGILAALYLLDFMVQTNETPSQLIDHLYSLVGAHYYDRIDTAFDEAKRAEVRQRVLDAKPREIAGLAVTGLNTTDGFKFSLADGGWLLIRFSGTEPIIRVYCETTRQDKVQDILQAGLALAGLR